MHPARLQRSLIAVLAMLLVPSLASADLLPFETPINQAIDHYIGLRQASDQVAPAPLAHDAALVRRLTLDLAGRIPTAEEARTFAGSQTPQKWTLWVDRLLASPDFAFHQRNEFDTMLLEGRNTGHEWREYLLEAARENRPWDEMFRDMMIGSEGNATRQGAMAFLAVRAKDLDDLTNDTSRLFFGVSISCAKCHDHPLVADWLQDHYYGLAAFFERTYLTKKKTLAEKYTGVVKFKTTAGVEKEAKFMFLTGAVAHEPEVERTKEQIKALEEAVRQQMKDDDAPPPEPPAFSPRAALVDLALDPQNHRFFARSIINRIWVRLMGRGLVDPPDQMHSSNPPSHPELLNWLERDLITHGYDLKRLIRGIVLSDAYARSSHWTGDGEVPDPEYFAVGSVRPLSPRQYALSLAVASRNPQTIPSSHDRERWLTWREQMENAASGVAGQFEIPGEHFQVSVDEALLLSNGQRIYDEYLHEGGDRLVGHLKTLGHPDQVLPAASWTVLSRPLAAEEREIFESYLADRSATPSAGIQQIVWAMLASPEMRFNY